MIRRLEVRNFRMLRANAVDLQPFQVLVGQNATGKSTFLNALQFLSDLLRLGVPGAVEKLAPSFLDLCFDPGRPIAMAVIVELPLEEDEVRAVRYEIEVGIAGDGTLRVLQEVLYILPAVYEQRTELQRSLFEVAEVTVVTAKTPRRWRKVVSKTREGRDYFRDEKSEWNNHFRFGLDRTALGSLPEDPARFPLSIATRNALRDGIRPVMLDAVEMRSPSPPGSATRLALDGSNLPHAVRSFQERHPALFDDWVAQVATAIGGLEAIGVRERDHDRHLVLEATFEGAHGAPVPSWGLSDGSLRLMALTLLSYAASDDLEIFLVEEPENGLHPLAIQAVFSALSDPGERTQFLCATHSPIFLAQAELDQTLVFHRSPEGFSQVRRGPELQELEEWTGQVSLSDLFVTGILS